MFDAMIESLLADVERPSRYLGREVNAVVREPSPEDLKVCLAYPGSYEEGALDASLNALYGLLAGRPGFHVERAFRPAPDLELRLREAGLPWFSLETRRPLPGFDLVVLLWPSPDEAERPLAFLSGGGILKTRAVRWPMWAREQEGRARTFFLTGLRGSLRDLRLGTDLLHTGSVPLVETEPSACTIGPARYVVPFAQVRGVAIVDCPGGLVGALEGHLQRLVLETGLERFRVRMSEPPASWEPPESLESLLVGKGVRVEFDCVGAREGIPFLSLPRPGRRAPVEPRSRVRLRLERRGPARWLSHREQSLALRRALRRSELRPATDNASPPRFRLAFGPAVSVGHESDCEYVDLWLADKPSPEEAAERFGRALPSGARILQSRRVPLHFPSVEAAANAALWEAEGAWPEDLAGRLADFEGREELWIEKRSPKKVTRINLRQAATFLREGGRLKMLLRPPSGESLRPEEALRALGLFQAGGASEGSTTPMPAGKGPEKGAAIRLVRRELFARTASGETLSL